MDSNCIRFEYLLNIIRWSMTSTLLKTGRYLLATFFVNCKSLWRWLLTTQKRQIWRDCFSTRVTDEWQTTSYALNFTVNNDNKGSRSDRWAKARNFRRESPRVITRILLNRYDAFLDGASNAETNDVLVLGRIPGLRFQPAAEKSEHFRFLLL